MELIKKEANLNIGKCTLIYLFKICLNPYEEFKSINFDFHKFYEDNENISLEEIKL